MAKWPYNTTTWQALRKAKLTEAPLCEPCSRRGEVVVATVVDHVVAIAKGGPAFPGLDGLMSMCQRCHSEKTAAVDRPGGKGVAIKGAGIDGLPVDASHPFFSGGDTPSKDQELPISDRRGRFAHS